MASAARRLVGFGMVFGMLAVGMFAGMSGTNVFIDIPSIAFVLSLVIGGLLVSFGPSAILGAMSAALGSGQRSPEQLAQSIRVLDSARRLGWAGGLLCMLIGLVKILSNLGSASQVAAGMAVALLTVLYGGILAELVFNPLKYALLSRTTESETAAVEPARARRSNAAFVGTACFLGVLVVVILLLTFTKS